MYIVGEKGAEDIVLFKLPSTIDKTGKIRLASRKEVGTSKQREGVGATSSKR